MPARCGAPQAASSKAGAMTHLMSASLCESMYPALLVEQRSPSRNSPMKTILAAGLLSLATLPALAAEPRPQDRWKLEDIYADDAAFNADAARLESQLP